MAFFRLFLIPCIISLFINNLNAQIINGSDTLYGNEWINYSQNYFKINITSDCIYRVSSSTLQNSDIPLSNIKGSQLRLYRMGIEIPIFTSTSDVFSNSDFIEFYGLKNKSDLDNYMFKTGENGVLNPDFSIITDTMSYFLTWVSDNSVGKRIQKQANNLSNLPVKEPWFWYDDRRNYSQQDAQYRYGDVYIPEFSKGEGYGSAWAKDFNVSFNPQNVVNTEGGLLYVRWANQQYHISLISLNNEVLDRDTSNIFTLNEKNIALNSSQMKGNMSVALSGNYSDIDRISVGVAQLTYARQFNFGNNSYFEFNIESSNSAKYLEIDNFNTANVAPILYDVTNNLRVETVLENGKIKVALPPSVSKRKLILFNANTGFQTVSTLNKVNFRDFKTDNAEYIIISSDKFINDGVASEYAQYRQSAAGGGFKTAVFNIKDLYDNFGYGIQRHPMAIRDFTHFIKKNWSNPQFIVLMGKAREFNAVRSSVQLTSNISTFDIPTWGYPGSDILMVASNNSDRPIIPIGRIAASTPTDVKVYLDKIKDLENIQKNAPQTIADRDFLKNMLHLSGGGTVGVPIKNQLKTYEGILTKGKFGASVSTFYKNSVDPVEIAQNDKIFDRINKGLSLITFFGHSATSVLEFDVNNPNLLNNKGKMPVFFALGCSAGNVHQPSVGVSENFLFYPNKGMSAFVGTSGTSYLSSLINLGNNLYDLIANENYGSEIGKIIQKTIEKTGNNVSPDVNSVMQAFTINGDPAVKIGAAKGPDYIVDASTVKINPALVTAQLDSIYVSFELVNIGTTVKDSIKIALKQQLSDGTVVDLKTSKVSTPQYRSGLDIKIPISKSIGVNRLFISLDIDNRVTELPSPTAESNNELIDQSGKRGYEFLILANNVMPAYPANFSIIGKTPITLKASTSNPLAPAQNYFFEIDTTQLFNSPLKRSTTINSKGGVLKWQPNITYQDSIVYYWRTAVEPTNGQPTNWQNSSFTYINGKSGWSQGHYFQFLGNDFIDMKMNEGMREMEYVDDDLAVDIRCDPSSPRLYPALYLNNQAAAGNASAADLPDVSFLIAVFDFDKTRGNGTSWIKVAPNLIGPNYGISHNFINNFAFFTFDANSQDAIIGRIGAINFIENTIPNDAYVLFYVTTKNSTIRYNSSKWLVDSILYNKNIFNLLEKKGARYMRELINKDSIHYYFFFKKGSNEIIDEKLFESYFGGLDKTFKIPRKWYTGSQSSQLIIRSKKWDKLDINYTTGIGDTLGIDIIGVSENKAETTLKTNITASSTSLSDIDATKYPYLKLKYESRDIRQQTPPQLKSWRVYYQGLPDLAVNPLVNYSKYNDTIQQGDKFAMSVGVENISDYDADSVAVALTLKNEQNQEIVLNKKIQAISAGNSAIAPFNYDTKPLTGKQQAFFEVNPKLAQPESFTANNYLQTNFTVQGDKTNPLLDVTFDGLRVLNNDIVSTKPQISIKLRDDNKYLALNDTSIFKLVIEPISPSGLARTIYFNDPSVKFSPASLNSKDENNALIELSPDFLKDGTYKLSVSGKDASGNRSAIDYSVQFRVISQQSISNLLPYPNPFSTSTRFAYTLTGDSPPQYLTIQIMSVSGKVVREITSNEIGQLKIGTHLTDYAWDGKDDFGNLLANGVYLYRVITKDKNKQKIGKYNSDDNSDIYFKKDIGKIVIMR